MTKRFDQLLLEMMPASFEGGDFGAAIKSIKDAIPPKDVSSYHFKALQQLDPETQEKVIDSIVKKVFPEKDYTYSSDINNLGDLKSAITKAIIDTANEIPEFKPGGKTMVGFLADRLANKARLGNVKYTTQDNDEDDNDDDDTNDENKVGEITQKDLIDTFNDIIKNDDSTIDDEDDVEKDLVKPNLVYFKAADVDSNDDDLVDAFNKLPDDKNLTWQEIIRTIGVTKAKKLVKIGALIEEPIDSEDEDLEFDDPEDGEIEDLELVDDESEDDDDELNFDDEEYDDETEFNVHDVEDLIDPYYHHRKNPYGDILDD